MVKALESQLCLTGHTSPKPRAQVSQGRAAPARRRARGLVNPAQHHQLPARLQSQQYYSADHTQTILNLSHSTRLQFKKELYSSLHDLYPAQLNHVRIVEDIFFYLKIWSRARVTIEPPSVTRIITRLYSWLSRYIKEPYIHLSRADCSDLVLEALRRAEITAHSQAVRLSNQPPPPLPPPHPPD